MIEYINRLGAGPPVPGPAPTPTTPVVWALNTTIDTVGGHPVTDAHTILDPEENERATRFRTPGLTHRYTTSHLALRTILAL
ncbi:4-phosphopantetheinyl transferase, partial [Streptomyces erythrochromogenes]